MRSPEEKGGGLGEGGFGRKRLRVCAKGCRIETAYMNDDMHVPWAGDPS